MFPMPINLQYILSFIVLCFSAHYIGKLFSAFRLPYITGYLFAGALVGSSGLGLLPHEANASLLFINQAALGLIAFIAGSELYLRELRKQVKTIVLISAGIISVMLLVGSPLIFFLSHYIPFTQGFDAPSKWAVALLGATILLALSPPSTIAVIKEVRAKGPFTRTALSVTVVIDVAIVFCFALSVNFVEPLLDASKSIDLRFILLIILDLALALGVGYLTGFALKQVLLFRIPNASKMALILFLGYAIFWMSKTIKGYTIVQGPFPIHIEPLLTAMIAGIYVTNFTVHRDLFEELLHDLSVPVYVAFFTLTGLVLEASLLWAMLPFAALLFVTRALSIYIGSNLGGRLAHAPKQFSTMSWMAFITQAGIALGLSAEAAMHFPKLGIAFQTLIVSVILLNEIFGPLFLKNVLRMVGEANEPMDVKESPSQRRAVILGIDGQSITLARQLVQSGWQVLMCDADSVRVQLVSGKSIQAGIEVQHMSFLSKQAIERLLAKTPDAFVIMLETDRENLRACKWVREESDIRLIVRLHSASVAEQFHALNVFVLDQTSAMVNLIQQAVVAPQSTALLMHEDTQRQIRQIKVTNSSVDDTLVRDLRLPADVLLLDVIRDEAVMVPNGFTRIRVGDELTVIGHPEDLDVVTMRLGY